MANESQNARDSEKAIEAETKCASGECDDSTESEHTFSRSERERSAERAKPARSHQKAERVGAAAEDMRRHRRHQHGVRHAHEAHQREQQQHAANGRKPGDVAPAFLELPAHPNRLRVASCSWQAHRHERRDDRNVADCVDQEAIPLAGGGDQHACNGRPEQPRGVHHR